MKEVSFIAEGSITFEVIYIGKAFKLKKLNLNQNFLVQIHQTAVFSS
jgi:hypothetical protein